MCSKIRVMIAGIAGASLGTEILKCLVLAGRYEVYGCDISPLACGHYIDSFEQTFVVERNNYIDSVLDACRKSGVEFLIPGAEEPTVLISEAREAFADNGIKLAMNSAKVISLTSDKAHCFKVLKSLGFAVPETKLCRSPQDIGLMPMPCVIKPSKGSGGSAFAFLAENTEEAVLYSEYLIRNGKDPLVQQYLPVDEGEFTVGVLSLPHGETACSVALKRQFDCKLSVVMKSELGVISSGYSQGIIQDFPEHRSLAESLAAAIGSTGPLNIQGRVRNGSLLPFEINARFSASTYLRAMAGINEVDLYLQYLLTGHLDKVLSVRPGLYLRSLSECYVAENRVKK